MAVNFNPRSPCGERRLAWPAALTFRRFQSTLPVRGATAVRVFDWHLQLSISIHAPRAGSDYLQQDAPAAPGYFNPRSPCGERLCPFRPPSGSCTISIHAPRAGSDIAPRSYAVIISRISIHAPRAGSDHSQVCKKQRDQHHFNPRSPCGERL